jgi:hypothetical protein
MSLPSYYKDNKGRVIGNVRDDGSKKIYSNEKGQVLAYVMRDSTGRETTLSAKGQLVGSGDQGLRLFK